MMMAASAMMPRMMRTSEIGGAPVPPQEVAFERPSRKDWMKRAMGFESALYSARDSSSLSQD